MENLSPSQPRKFIKKVKKEEPKKSLHIPLWFKITFWSVLICSLLAGLLVGADMFFDRYDLKFQLPIIIRSPLVIGDRQLVSPLPKKKEIKPTPTEKQSFRIFEKVYAEEITPDREIAEYIASKDWDYSVAIRIAKSENFWNLTKSFDCRRQGGVNSNGTRDHGLWQINDIHIQSGAISLEDALDCKKSTDFAYGLYANRGNFTAWSAFNNGSYLSHDVIEL